MTGPNRPPAARLVSRARRVPWTAVAATAIKLGNEAHQRWKRLTPYEQEELRRLLQRSQGRPANLTANEKRRIRAIVMKAVKNG